MKTFHIKDEDGKEYEVEEIKAETSENPVKDDALTDDEIAALKKLASVADKLIALTSTDKVEDEDENEDKDVDVDIDVDKDDEEEVVDTDTTKSMNALEKKANTMDSIDVQDSVNDAWAKYYGGQK